MASYRIQKRVHPTAAIDFVVLDESDKIIWGAPAEEQAKTMVAALNFPKAWKKRVAAALPRKLPENRRSALVVRIAERILRWHSIDPEIERYRARLTRLTKQADKLQASVDRIEKQLLRFTVDSAYGMQRADSALHLIVQRTAQDLSSWNQFWRPAESRPPRFSVALGTAIKTEFELYCGAGSRGFNKLLAAIQNPQTQRLVRTIPKLPNLNLATIGKRKQRRVKRTKRT